MKLKNDWWGYGKDYGWAVMVDIFESSDGGDALFYGFKEHSNFRLPFKNLEDHGITFALRYFKSLSGKAQRVAKAEFETCRASWPTLRAKYFEAEQQRINQERDQAESARRLQAEQKKAAELEETARHARQMQERQQFEEHRIAAERKSRAARVDLLKQRMLSKQHAECRQIAEFMEIHRIPYLVHFTRIENLSSIIERGIVPRIDLWAPEFVYNDSARLDEFLEASCLTIGYPNWRMFYKYRCQDDKANWVALTVSPKALTVLPCLFHSTNAASAKFADKSDKALESRMGLSGLQSMFYDEPQGIRIDRALASYWTTDPQAEVLAFETIPVGLITSVVLLRKDVEAMEQVSKLAPALECTFGGKLFSPRQDYQFWQSNWRDGSDIASKSWI